VTGIFIALEGPDGVGKTTLAGRLGNIDYETAVAALPRVEQQHPSLVFVGRRQTSGTSPYAANLMQQLANVLWRSGDRPDLPDAFWVGVQAAWFTAHATSVVQPLLEAGYDVVVDGWVFKFFSKLLVQGYSQDDLDVIFARVRMPDTVVLLTADPAALYYRRRARFRPAELGMHAGYRTLNRDTFVDYQLRGLDHLRGFAAQRGWPIVALDPHGSVDDALAVLAPMIASLRTRREPVTARP
jgi:thymidylate kinase